METLFNDTNAITNLPNEIITEIASNLDAKDLCCFSQTCKKFLCYNKYNNKDIEQLTFSSFCVLNAGFIYQIMENIAIDHIMTGPYYSVNIEYHDDNILIIVDMLTETTHEAKKMVLNTINQLEYSFKNKNKISSYGTILTVFHKKTTNPIQDIGKALFAFYNLYKRNTKTTTMLYTIVGNDLVFIRESKNFAIGFINQRLRSKTRSADLIEDRYNGFEYIKEIVSLVNNLRNINDTDFRALLKAIIA